MATPRIILTCNFSPWSSYRGGGQNSTHQLASALTDLGHSVEVIYTRGRLDKIVAPQTVNYRIHWADFAALRSYRQAPLRPLNALSVAHVARKIVQRAAGRVVVHSQGEEGVGVPVALPRTPWILTPRFPNYPDALLQTRPARRALARLWALETKYMILRASAAQAFAVCPTSDATGEMIKTALRVPAEKIRVVPNGIHPAFANAVRVAPQHKESPIVFFGRVETTKGTDTLLQAYATVANAPPLRIIGDGGAKPEFQALATTLGIADRTSFEDWLSPEQLAHILATARLVVLPSREESFGNAMVETMATGVPLITTHVGSIPAVTHDGQWASLVSPGDVSALARAIERTLQSPNDAEARASVAQRGIRESYSWSRTARTFAEIYQEACD